MNEQMRRGSFERLAEPLRRELKLHCYRMMGSLHEAEDLVQETYLRAWRGFEGFEPDGSFRAWLYRIATNACLTALAGRKSARRFLPDHRPSAAGPPDGVPSREVAWLEPYPDGELDVIADEAPGPEARYEARQAVRLAFVAVIQRLPPRQRAVLLLCDVMGWSSAETAALLGGSTASVNSALQRARATLVRLHPEGRSAEEPDAGQRQLLERYLQAWEAFDLDGFAALLRDDVVYTMPPLPQWYAGRAAVRTFFAMVWPLYRGFRLIATAANGQPAFAGYSRNASGSGWSPHSIHVLTLKKGEISRLTLFVKPDAPALFAPFGLPAALDQ